MNDQTAYTDLGPLYEPGPVAFSFSEPGWIVLFTLVGLAFLYVLFRLVRTYIRQTYRREALRLIDAVQDQFHSAPDARHITDVMIVVKQTAITTFSREEVADLHGTAWLEFLDHHGKGSSFLANEPFIFSALYKNELEDPAAFDSLARTAKHWIRRHA